MLRFIYTFLLSTITLLLFSQDIPRDTSFNLRDDYQKNIKKFPHIKSVPLITDSVRTLLNVVYSTTNDRDLHVDIYAHSHPKTDAAYPTIIMIHGGGWRSGNKEMMAGFASALAVRGYCVVVPEYRLSLEAIYPAGIDDLKELIKWCYTHKRKYKFDTSRLAVLGTSSGGQMASQLGNNVNTEYKVSATVNIDGVLAFRHPESSEGAVAIQWLGGTYEEKSEIWLEASALHNVSKETAPILFVGSSMPRFHAGRSDMIRKLDDIGIYSDILVFEESPHTFWFYEPWFTPMLKKINDFLRYVWKSE
jgi:pectinesterase